MNEILRATAARLGAITNGPGIRVALLGLLILAAVGSGHAATAAVPPPAKSRTDRILVKPRAQANLGHGKRLELPSYCLAFSRERNLVEGI